MSMTSHERVMTTLCHKKPDRPPLNYFGTPETTKKLLEHLSLDTSEELLCYLGADMRYVAPAYVGPSEFSSSLGYGCGGTDMWGISWKQLSNEYCAYYEVAKHPLKDFKTLEEIKQYPWPSPDWLSVEHIKEDIQNINRSGPKAITLVIGHFFEIAWYLRGFEQFLEDIMLRPEIADFILAKVTGLLKEVALRAVEAADGQIDIAWTGGDIGMQTGMLLSPNTWRTAVKPWQRELTEPFKQMGMKTRYHTDGVVLPVIEDMIEMGLDLLDPIQPKATGMDAENLKKLFGGRLCFYGGVDTQELLPFGTAAEVEADVLRLIETLGADGGYVVAASNAVQPDVPVENILALYRTAREYRY